MCTPAQTYLRVTYSATSSFILAAITIKGIDFAKRNASDAWNSLLACYFIPDYYTFSDSFQTSSVIYMNEELTFTLMLRGKDPGLYFNTTTGFGGFTSLSVGFDDYGNLTTIKGKVGVSFPKIRNVYN